MIKITEKIDTGNIRIQPWNHPEFEKKEINVDILRLDLIHPLISGNKWFKLKYHLDEALKQGKTGIVSFGGVWSNHLVALACACNRHGLQSAAIIRGEEPAIYNAALQHMKDYGMKLIFISRTAYRDKKSALETFFTANHGYYYVPEGGQSDKGIAGAAEILSLAPSGNYTHIACAIGTGTTITGIINSAGLGRQVIGICSLKIPGVNAQLQNRHQQPPDINAANNELIRYIHNNTTDDNYTLFFDYHFGGYAKKSAELIAFMNDVYQSAGIPTDIVYTGKLFYAIADLAKKGHFHPGNRILIIHSGGLTGNKSLPAGILDF